MSTDAEEVKVPKKSLFKMNEVCGMAGVKPYVLRFWENEFEEIAPVTSSLGQKLYSLQDIEFIAKIKKLLFKEKMTIERIKAHIRSPETAEALDNPVASAETPEEIPQKAQEVSEESLQKDAGGLVAAKHRLESLLAMADLIREKHAWK